MSPGPHPPHHRLRHRQSRTIFDPRSPAPSARVTASWTRSSSRSVAAPEVLPPEYRRSASTTGLRPATTRRALPPPPRAGVCSPRGPSPDRRAAGVPGGPSPLVWDLCLPSPPAAGPRTDILAPFLDPDMRRAHAAESYLPSETTAQTGPVGRSSIWTPAPASRSRIASACAQSRSARAC